MPKHKRNQRPSHGYVAGLLRRLADRIDVDDGQSTAPTVVRQARAAASRLSSQGRPAPRSIQLALGVAALGIAASVTCVGHAYARTRVSLEDRTCERLRWEQPDYTGSFAVMVHHAAFDADGKPVDHLKTFRCNPTSGGEGGTPREIVIYVGRRSG